MSEPTEASFNLLTALFQDQPMAAIWSERASIGAWLRIEGELARAQAELGLISAGDAALIATACSRDTIDRDRLWENAVTWATQFRRYVGAC